MASWPEPPWLGAFLAWIAPCTVLLTAVTVEAAAATGDWLAGAEPVPEPPCEPAVLVEAVGACASWLEPPWPGVLLAWTAPCTVLLAAVTVAAAAATGAFAADVAVDVTVPAALTVVPDAVASDWVEPCSAWPAPVTVAATAVVAVWAVWARAGPVLPSTVGTADVTADVTPPAA